MPEQRPRRRPRRDPRRRGQLYRWQRLLTRLGVLTLGGSLVLGGLSSLWRGTEPTPAVTLGIPSPEPQPLLPPLDLRVEQTSLQQELAALNPSPRLTVSALFLDLDTGEYAQLDPEAVFPAASTIKLPILVALLEAVDQGQVTWTEPLTLTSALLAGEAGTLKNRPLGSRISVLEAGTLMSVISDNTGTNLIIDRLGGIEGVNERFRAWGLRHTQLNALLPD
ncbi:MAG: serine hydrolase, partial [Thermostichales cyanobacterium SRBZ-1_bins_19]